MTIDGDVPDTTFSYPNFDKTRLDRFPESRRDPVRDTLALVLAGGEGTRLQPLTRWRCKPSVPFGGKYRLIDFTLSNCINSGIRRIGVLVQYKSHLLLSHLQKGWSIFNGEFNEYLEILPAQQQNGRGWYSGTADAVYQNLTTIKSHHPKYILVLAGDHIYKADYRRMIEYHIDTESDMTVGCIEVPASEVHSFGIMETDKNLRLTAFHEKPPCPPENSDTTDTALASMGIYVFSREFLYRVLEEDAASSDSTHDFGHDIIPACLQSSKVSGYPFSQAQHDHYWKDVGTLDAYYKSSMDLVRDCPEIDLYDSNWPIWSFQQQLPPAKFVFNNDNTSGYAADSLVSSGCIVTGAQVRGSILHTGVRIREDTIVESSILLPDVQIGKNCRIKNSIIEECCSIQDGSVIGYDTDLDRERFHITEHGITVVCADMLMAKSKTYNTPERLVESVQ